MCDDSHHSENFSIPGAWLVSPIPFQSSAKFACSASGVFSRTLHTTTLNASGGRGLDDTSTGATYVGNLQDNQREGRGIWTHRDGTVYDGEWRVNEATGHGRLIRPMHGEYVGEFLSGLVHGDGTLTRVDGWQYDGKSGQVALRQ